MGSRRELREISGRVHAHILLDVLAMNVHALASCDSWCGTDSDKTPV